MSTNTVNNANNARTLIRPDRTGVRGHNLGLISASTLHPPHKTANVAVDTLSISDEARRLFARAGEQLRGKDVSQLRREQMEFFNLDEFVKPPDSSPPTNAGNISGAERNFWNSPIDEFISQSANSLSGFIRNPWTNNLVTFRTDADGVRRYSTLPGFESQDRAETGIRDAISFKFNIARRDMEFEIRETYLDPATRARMNASALAEVYADMRQTLEERYSGEELEKRLRWLSEGFDSIANDIADEAASQTGRYLDDLRRNAELTGEELSEFNRISAELVDLVRATVLAFVNSARDFANNVN
ncbi:MAG: hypothetical protein FWC20_00315 [Oscillospiraceae bacterium]|nr:hypothetical protein [Oscillospiraceae bacterium]MCL2277835.1 hypothetical protein [Oscillospiraceae bacterium]